MSLAIIPNGASLTFPKNRSIAKPFVNPASKPLTPVIRLLALAVIGLASSGTGTPIDAPLAAAWSFVMLITSHLSNTDIIRIMIIHGRSFILVGVAILMDALSLSSYSQH